MKERPILFSAPMVRAILAGAKTQTRRILSARELAELQPDDETEEPARLSLPPRYGVPGDRLWVRETWDAPPGSGDSDEVIYRADLTPEQEREEKSLSRQFPAFVGKGRWRPSIHMPRALSRITLEVTAVRVERLQDISEEDARAEGVAMLPDEAIPPAFRHGPCKLFQYLWDEINAKRAPWASNPWVWVLGFSRVPAVDPPPEVADDERRPELAAELEHVDAQPVAAPVEPPASRT